MVKGNQGVDDIDSFIEKQLKKQREKQKETVPLEVHLHNTQFKWLMNQDGTFSSVIEKLIDREMNQSDLEKIEELEEG